MCVCVFSFFFSSLYASILYFVVFIVIASTVVVAVVVVVVHFHRFLPRLQSKDAQDAIQKATDKHAKIIDERVAAKEKDIMKV